MESLIQDQDKIVHKGTTIKYKYQALVVGVSNQSHSKNKDLKQREKEKKESSSEISSSTDGRLKSKRRNKREISTCDYFRVSDIERYFFRKEMDIMTKLLEENHISLPEFTKIIAQARKWYD